MRATPVRVDDGEVLGARQAQAEVEILSELAESVAAGNDPNETLSLAMHAIPRVLRWDEEHVSRSAVINQAIDLCGGFGHRARRAIAIADNANGTVHTTRFACRALPNIPGTPGVVQ